MPEYLTPGVYVEEAQRGPRLVTGAATSTVAFLGETERGSVRPQLVTNYGAFLRLYGDVFAEDKYLPYAIRSFFENGGGRCFVARITGEGASTSSTTIDGFTVTAVGPGTCGDRIWIRVGPGTRVGPDGQPIGFRLRIDYWADGSDVPADAGPIDGRVGPTTSEDFDDLSVDPTSSTFYETVVNVSSSLIAIAAPADVAVPSGDSSALLAGGGDGCRPASVEFRGEATSPSERTGLAALDLDLFNEVAIVHAPGVDYAVAREVVAHCERNRNRFAVVDPLHSLAEMADIAPRNDITDTSYGAFYYPWIYIDDPHGPDPKLIPPGGAACGIYARTDNARGVSKAPANEIVRGAIDLEYEIDQATHDVLNPRGVNAIRQLPGRGIRLWGARTMSSDPSWKYIPVRRLFIFLEASLYQSMQWVVFEPNDERLWFQAKRMIAQFLQSQWRDGALSGSRPEEAFTIAVGRTTMTADDIRQGRLIIEVGVAPVRPAEFIVFRIHLKTREGHIQRVRGG